MICPGELYKVKHSVFVCSEQRTKVGFGGTDHAEMGKLHEGDFVIAVKREPFTDIHGSKFYLVLTKFGVGLIWSTAVY